MRVIKNRVLKCYWCNERDREDKIEVMYGKQKRRYHAGQCYESYLEDQEFKKQEAKELDQLYETIKDVCDVTTIPPSFMGLIQRLRNGDPVIGMRKSDTKQFKQGFKYPVIQLAYEQKSDLIRWKRGQWDGTIGRFLTFVLFYYIMDVIENANEQWDDMQRQIEEQQRQQVIAKSFVEDEWTYSNQENNHDISSLLD